jgi:DNA polymerase-3 subunit beta
MPEVKLQTKSFAEAFSRVSSVCPARTTMPMLKSVLFQFTQDGGTLIASDSEIGIRGTLTNIQASESGECLLPVDRMSSILGAVVDDLITIKITDAKLEIKCGYSKFNLGAEDPKGFSPVTCFNDQLPHRTVPSAKLRDMITKTVFAVDQSAQRHATQGLCVEDNGAMLTIFATDKRRIAVIGCDMGSTGPLTREGKYPILPPKALLAVNRFLGDEGEVSFVQNENQSLFRYGNYTLVTQHIVGIFPNCRKIIPSERLPLTIEMVSSSLMATLKQAMVMTNAESCGVKFQFANGNLKIDSVANGVGDSAVEMPISYSGADITIALNPAFIVEYLKAIGVGVPFTWEMSHDPDNLVQLRCGDYIYCVAPFNV